MAVLITLLEQHLDRQAPTVVAQDTTWWETVITLVKLQEIGLGVHLPVKVLLHPVYLWSFHESSEILLRPFLDYNDASRLLDDRLPYVAVPGRNRTLFCCIFRSHYCIRSALAWNFRSNTYHAYTVLC